MSGGDFTINSAHAVLLYTMHILGLSLQTPTRN